MGSHSITFHPTQVNTPQPDRLVLDLPTLEGWKAELTLYLTLCDLTGEPVILLGRGLSGLVYKKPVTLVCLSLSHLPLKALTLGASAVCWSKLQSILVFYCF